MNDSLLLFPRLIVKTHALSGLNWQNWEDVYIVYQPSSTETHVFNETTATVLRCLEGGPMTMDGLAGRVVQSLGIEPDELTYEDLVFATGRLEALGLIEWADGAVPGP